MTSMIIPNLRRMAPDEEAPDATPPVMQPMSPDQSTADLEERAHGGTADLEAHREATPHMNPMLQQEAVEPSPQGPPPTGKQRFHNTMADFEHRAETNRAEMIGLDPSDPDYAKKLSALQAQHGALTTEKARYQMLHPWGGPESAHPGVLGKIGHVAGKIGQIAGEAIRPDVVQAIPGTQSNLASQGAAGEKEMAAGEAGAEKAAQTGEAEARTGLIKQQTEELENKPEDEWKVVPGMTDAQGRVLQESAGGELRWAPDISGVGPLKPNASEAPLQNVDQLNKAMERRWQVLNPEQPMPPEYQLQPNATQKDFDRVDKLLSQNESAVGTKAQRDTANEMRQQALELAKQNAADRTEQRGLKWVSYTDAAGNTVAAPMSEAKAAGAQNMAELPAQEVRDMQNARHVVKLMTKTGDPGRPETNGVLQLIDSLDKDGKLGVLASRYNKFLVTGVGASPGDDPRIITLIDKNMLSDTGTMLAHFGASGGRSPQMLQHFLDLQNSAKMDGVTLRAGAKAIADYMADRAMLPSEQKGGGGGAKPPHAPDPGMKWQQNKKTGEFRQVPLG